MMIHFFDLQSHAVQYAVIVDVDMVLANVFHIEKRYVWLEMIKELPSDD